MIFINNTYATLGATHAPGSTALVLGSGQGAQFGSSFPITVTCIKALTYRTTTETLTIFTVTGISGDTLIVSGTPAENSTDPGYSVGDVVEMRWTAGEANTLSANVTNLLNSITSAVAKQTSNYSAQVAQFVPIDTTSSSVTVTLPSAPANNSVVAVKHV